MHSRESSHQPAQRIRRKVVFAIPLIIVCGLACKLFRGPFADFMNNFGPASVAYVMLISLILFGIHPNPSRTGIVVVFAFLLTCAVEFTQLINTPWLEKIRSFVVGRLIMGTTFGWWDFPAYAAGALASWFLLKRLADSNR